MKPSPILLFTYNRLCETKQTIEALQKNSGATESKLFLFSDAPKNENAQEGVDAVRKYLKNVDGFKEIAIIERDKNLGLANSIITGVSEIIEQYEQVIVLEDDLITTANFLSFMNQSLNEYRNSNKVWSISGYSYPIEFPKKYQYDATFGIRATSWGWATWKDRWEKVDWDVSNYDNFKKDFKARKAFNQGGSDLCKMLNDQMTGKINSWAIRFCYAQFKNNAYDLYPRVSKVKSIGFESGATHTKGMEKRFATKIDQSGKENFRLPLDISINKEYLSQFQSNFSICNRLKYKILRYIK